MIFIALYLAAVSMLAIILTTHDKSAARRHKWRVRESTLLLIAALGGSIAMLITMRIIRHKTKHAKFMIGIPVMIAVQIAAVAALMILK
jgi:uncharacterized membrane protein YsdA (DUF1294 family)